MITTSKKQKLSVFESLWQNHLKNKKNLHKSALSRKRIRAIRVPFTTTLFLQNRIQIQLRKIVFTFRNYNRCHRISNQIRYRPGFTHKFINAQ